MAQVDLRVEGMFVMKLIHLTSFTWVYWGNTNEINVVGKELERIMPE